MEYKGTVTFNTASDLANGLYRSSQNVNLPVNVVPGTAKCYGSGTYSGRFMQTVRVNSASTIECMLFSGAAFAGGSYVNDASIIVEATKA